MVITVYSLLKSLPAEEKYALSDQIRRSVVSVPSNIAEGHGRNSDNEFIKFLYISRGSLLELETQIEICFRLNYITALQRNDIMDTISQVTKMINALITYRIRNIRNDYKEE